MLRSSRAVARRHLSTGGKPVPASAAFKTSPPKAAPHPPAVPPKAAETPGSKDTKQGAGLAGVFIPLLAIGSAAGAYFAYQQGLIPKEVLKALGVGAEGSAAAPVSAAKAAAAQIPAAEAHVDPPEVKAATPLPPLPAQTPVTVEAPIVEEEESISSAVDAPVHLVAEPAVDDAKEHLAATLACDLQSHPPPTEPEPEPVPATHAEEAALPPTPGLVDDSSVVIETATEAASASDAPAEQPTAAAVLAPLDALTAAAVLAPLDALAQPTAAAVLAPLDALAQATAAAGAWQAEQVKQLLRRSDSDAAAAELAGSSVAELRERVLQLSAELQSRARWEAVRLIELLEKNDKRWSELFATYSAAQKAEAQSAADELLKAAKSTLEAEFSEELQRKVAAAHERAEAEWHERFRVKLLEAAARMGEEAEGRIKELSDLRARVVGGTEAFLASRLQYEAAARKAHRTAAAVLALEVALQRPAPATQEAAALAVAGEGDAVIARAVSLLPPQVHSAAGAATVSTLQLRYLAVSRAARAAALTPEGTGLIGQAVGAAAARLLANPSDAPAAASAATALVAGGGDEPATDLASSYSASSSSSAFLGPLLASIAGAAASAYTSVFGGGGGGGPVPALVAQAGDVQQRVAEGADKAIGAVRELAAVAEDRTAAVNRVNAVFARADAAVAAGDLEAAVDALSGLRGYTHEAVRDWLDAASVRVLADRATAIARARAAVLTAAMY